MVWLYVDILTKQVTYHSREDCTYVQNMEETEDKGLGEVKKSSGWISFPDLSDAIDYYKDNYPDFAILQHC